MSHGPNSRFVSRALKRLNVAVRHVSRGMVVAARILARRMQDLWDEMVLVLLDTWFRLSLLAVDLWRILLFLAPGLLLIVIGLTTGGTIATGLGALYCVALIVMAVKFGSDDAPRTAEDFAYEWSVHFRPSWLDDAELVEALHPVLNSYAEATSVLQQYRRAAGKDDSLGTFLRRIERELKKRMHHIQSLVHATKRKAGKQSWSEFTVADDWSVLEETTTLCTSIAETVVELGAATSSESVPDEGLQFRTADDLGEALRALQEIVSIHRQLG